MQSSAEQVSDLMKALSSKNRLLILCHLAEREHSVGDLARLLEMREPAMSQQLSLLRREGLVTKRRDGQSIFYALSREDIRRLMGFLYETYCVEDAGCEGTRTDGQEHAA